MKSYGDGYNYANECFPKFVSLPKMSEVEN